MSKGVAIPYIIAVLLGIAVIGIIGYWFFFLGGSLGGEVSSADCQRKLVTYCSIWLGQGYSGTSPGVGDWDDYAIGCSKIGIAAPTKGRDGSVQKCNDVLGRGEVTGGGPKKGDSCDSSVRGACGTLTCDPLLKICK